VCDTFSARGAELTGLKMRRITRGGSSDHRLRQRIAGEPRLIGGDRTVTLWIHPSFAEPSVEWLGLNFSDRVVPFPGTLFLHLEQCLAVRPATLPPSGLSAPEFGQLNRLCSAVPSFRFVGIARSAYRQRHIERLSCDASQLALKSQEMFGEP